MSRKSWDGKLIAGTPIVYIDPVITVINLNPKRTNGPVQHATWVYKTFGTPQFMVSIKRVKIVKLVGEERWACSWKDARSCTDGMWQVDHIELRYESAYCWLVGE